MPKNYSKCYQSGPIQFRKFPPPKLTPNNMGRTWVFQQKSIFVSICINICMGGGGPWKYWCRYLRKYFFLKIYLHSYTLSHAQLYHYILTTLLLCVYIYQLYYVLAYLYIMYTPYFMLVCICACCVHMLCCEYTQYVQTHSHINPYMPIHKYHVHT